MNFKRVTLVCGHYGSGKTNVAVNMAFMLRKQRDNVAILDLDIVNPYFRAKDSKRELEDAGIKVIASGFAGTNLDVPALPQEIYAVTDDRSLACVVDVGGDDAGAVALGRLAPALREENDYDMFLVVNMYRPLTRDAESVAQVKYEIEAASGLAFTAIINNSNLGAETGAEDIEASAGFAAECSRLTGLPVAATAIDETISGGPLKAEGEIIPLKLQRRPV